MRDTLQELAGREKLSRATRAVLTGRAGCSMRDTLQELAGREKLSRATRAVPEHDGRRPGQLGTLPAPVLGIVLTSDPLLSSLGDFRR